MEMTMKSISILIPHYRTWLWTASCVWHWKEFMPRGVEYEIIVCDNSPDHPSIRSITDTELGNNVTVVKGRPDFSSHGVGYNTAYKKSCSSWIFTSETDSFPIKEGWFDGYTKAVDKGFTLIGPSIPQSSGRYIHPAGALIHRGILDEAAKWAGNHKHWLFCNDSAVRLGTSNRPYHVVAREDWLSRLNPEQRIMDEATLWKDAVLWQEMRSFDEDSFDTYGQRTGIKKFEPDDGQLFCNKIGYEPGQWLAYFAEHIGSNVLQAPTQIEWMNGLQGKQAAHSIVFDGFVHVWCGTVSGLQNNIDSAIREFKLSQRAKYLSAIPISTRQKIEALMHDSQ